MTLIILAAIAMAGSAVTLRMTRRNLRSYRRAPADAQLSDQLMISVCVPARDEEENLAASLRSILANDHVNLEVLIYDDQSRDRTPEILREFASLDSRVRPVRSVSLPPGWNGKQHACAQMGFSARGDWLLFTDADVRLTTDALRRATAEAIRREVALLSTFPRQITATLGERLIVPMIFFLLFSYLPMRRMRETLMPSASAGCGQFLLVRAEAYRDCGGHTAFPASMHDGIALPRLLRRRGFRTDLFDGADLSEVRMYAGLAATWRGFAKNAYEGLGHFGLLMFLTVFHTVVFIVPWPALGWAILEQQWIATGMFAIAIGFSLIQRRQLGRRFGQPSWLALLHPVAVTMMTAIQWHSWWWHLTGRSSWRGRGQAAEERVTLVDQDDRDIGSGSKLAVHRGVGQWHRDFSVLVFNPAGQVLLQQRAATKYHFAGRWANACCGHPRPGETIIDAATRRLDEETGLRCEMTPVASFAYEARDAATGLVEREVDHVLTGFTHIEPTLNPLEAQASAWIEPDQLTRQLDAKDPRFAPWVSKVWRVYLASKEESRESVSSASFTNTG